MRRIFVPAGIAAVVLAACGGGSSSPSPTANVIGLPAPTSTPTAHPPTPTPTAHPSTPTATPKPTPTATAVATPVPTPTPTPARTPGGVIVGPSVISLIGTGSADAAVVTVSEVGYAAKPFSVDTSAHGVATATVGATVNGSASVMVTGVTAGSTNLIVTDQYGQKLTVPLTVTTTTVIGS